MQGDVFKPETIEAAFAAAKPDLVVFCAGVASVEEAKAGPTSIYSASAPQLVAGMAKYAVGRKRLLVVTSGGTNEDDSGEPWYFTERLEACHGSDVRRHENYGENHRRRPSKCGLLIRHHSTDLPR